MKDNFYRSVIGQASFGYACHEIIRDGGGGVADYRFVDVNAAFEELAGMKAASLMGRTVREVYQGMKGGTFDWIALYGNIHPDSGTQEFEQYSGPLEKWFKVQVQLPGEGCLLTLFYDISESKRAEERIRESEKRATLQRSGIVQLAIDQSIISGHLLNGLDHITKVLSETIGVGRASIWRLSDDHSKLICLSIYEADKGSHDSGMILKTALFPSYFRAIMAETRISAVDAQNDACTSELTESYFRPLGITSMLDAGILTEGRLIGVVSCEHTGPPRRWHSDEESFVTTIAAIVAQLFGNTERRMAEATLEESENKYRSLTSQLPVGVYRTTVEGQLVFSNPALAKMLNYDSVEELLQLNVKQLYVDLSERAKQLKASEKNYQIIQSEFQLRRKSGDHIWVRDNSRLIFDREGEPEYFDGVLEDITIQKATEKALLEAKEKAEQSDRLKSVFLANVSHEIRTPMNAIIGFMELLKNPDLRGDEINNYIHIIDQSGQRLLNTINDIIEISKIESGQSEVVYSLLNIAEVMRYNNDFFSQECREKGIELRLGRQISDEKRTLQTDRHKLDIILTNLINNAIKFTTHGIIEFGNYSEENDLVFFIRDTGLGIPADRQEAIFDRFVQADLRDTRSHEGSGLGLSIARAYVEMLGGKIWVKSEVGKGSTFFFSIPDNTFETVKPVFEAKDEIPEAMERGFTVLVAEDDEFSYKYLEQVLTDKGVEVLRAGNGDEAVRMVRENPDISLILMDMKMPGIDGFEATRQIREFNDKVPVIAQTAYAWTGDREKALEAGCNDYISKPIIREELIRQVNRYTRTGTGELPG